MRWSLALVVFVFLSGASGVAADIRQDPIRIQLGGEPGTLDPVQCIDQYGFGILRNTMRGLMGVDREGRIDQSGLGTLVKAKSKSNLVFEFEIKPEAKWSDGSPVSVDDFERAFRHLLDPKTASPNAEHFFAIKNAKAVFENKKPLGELGIGKIGARLRIELEKPDPMFLTALTLPAASPRREGAFDVLGPTTGTYRVKKIVTGETIELEPTSKAPAGARAILYRILREEMTALNLFETKKLDVVSTVPANDLLRLREKGFIKSFPSTTVFYLSFNTSRPPFDSVDARRALANCIDREALAKTLNGTFLPSKTYVPQELLGKSESEVRSKILPTEPLNKLRGRRFKFSFGASAFTKTVSEQLQFTFKKCLGADMELDPQELKVLLGRLRSEPPDMYLLGMSALANDPVYQLEAFSSAAQPNFSRFSNPAFEAKLAAFKGEVKPARRLKLARELDRLLVNELVVVVPLLQRTQTFAVQPALQNFYANPFQVLPLAALAK